MKVEISPIWAACARSHVPVVRGTYGAEVEVRVTRPDGTTQTETWEMDSRGYLHDPRERPPYEAGTQIEITIPGLVQD